MSLAVWYPITSIEREVVHAGSTPSTQRRRPIWPCRMNPFIFAPLTSAIAFLAEWGPPPLTSAWSTYGATQDTVAGLDTHVAGLPFFIGMPSAPGKVPK